MPTDQRREEVVVVDRATPETIERLVLSDAKGWRFLVGIVALVWISSRRRVATVAAIGGGLALAAPQLIAHLRP